MVRNIRLIIRIVNKIDYSVIVRFFKKLSQIFNDCLCLVKFQISLSETLSSRQIISTLYPSFKHSSAVYVPSVTPPAINNTCFILPHHLIIFIDCSMFFANLQDVYKNNSRKRELRLGICPARDSFYTQNNNPPQHSSLPCRRYFSFH